jgi:uncharacterized membrane protein
VLLFAMLLVLLLLWIEARRYRFFDVYRTRVRMLERHYFSQIFAPAAEADNDWVRMLGQDLRKPRFLITHREAMSRRLRRNYIWMFLILLLAWGLKIATPKLQQEGVHLELGRELINSRASAAKVRFEMMFGSRRTPTALPLCARSGHSQEKTFRQSSIA